jgi:hypothetical protein
MHLSVAIRQMQCGKGFEAVERPKLSTEADYGEYTNQFSGAKFLFLHFHI